MGDKDEDEEQDEGEAGDDVSVCQYWRRVI
jgi:hypothetical protein